MKNKKELFSKKNSRDLFAYAKKLFSGHGPYNPLAYKRKLVPEIRATTEEMYFAAKKQKEYGSLPMYSMRHVHPIRQSGPIPSFAGPYNMEDIKKTAFSLRVGWEPTTESTCAEELMRRVPGLTKKEAIKIQSLGFSPWEELDYAYLIVNNGIDVFFEPNSAYLYRQVVTNSKGEKIECLFPTNEPDEFTYMPFSNHTGSERMDHVWDPVPGEPPLIPMPDYELGIPASYFEYEIDNRLHYQICADQQYIPEDDRPCPVPKNPNCDSDYWRPQADLEEDRKMEDSNWVPKTKFDVYNANKFSGSSKYNLDQNSNI